MTTPAPSQRDPITCHVLDTTTGRPAPNIAVKLSWSENPNITFSSVTNRDGRIANWQFDKSSFPMEDLYNQVRAATGEGDITIEFMITNWGAQGKAALPKGSSMWKLEFDTGAYFGIEKTFFPKVELTFLVKPGEHFHVPLLLGPYSYTTYRGS
ncbi:5-hydroxyisourate hydrolase [Venustampulla echinocandica]|uniref:5-hydroxyisourate hydrolase n=1 Tax=Venustampulla echinocandica TaxID=2656787 RepID=A0A370TQ82_9HELO|nr:5-hydroxyisourate hydrolase [Venustampulla echinocandica]RDL37685.1 5-hydroxyisourate hydrolase [Venustampulla echinocandica]